MFRILLKSDIDYKLEIYFEKGGKSSNFFSINEEQWHSAEVTLKKKKNNDNKQINNRNSDDKEIIQYTMYI